MKGREKGKSKENPLFVIYVCSGAVSPKEIL
jgi:hypothetical protein